ncbi:MAG: hypothetical protein GX927_03515, partial [Lentisphaerae bacterium]|nr:hypothetical protein [Lentisphaerota bacterium]
RVFMQIGRLGGTAPAVDGKLNDPCWERAAAFSPMASNMGGGNTNYTQAYAAYDNENLFIAVRAWDEELDPVKNQLHQIVKGKTGANANSWNADSIEVFVAPRQNSPDQYFQFGFNLAGGYDAIHPQKSIQWESGVESAAQLLDHRWEMEIRIPLKALGVSGDLAGKRWFFNLCRNKHGGNQKNAVWSPTNGSFHNYSRFGEVEFVARAPRIELKEKAISSGKEGGNELNFKITSDQDQTLTFRNFVSYQNADSAVAEDSVQVRAGKTTEFRNSYFVAAGTPERKSSESFSCNYEIRDADGKLIQRSATTTFPLDRYAPLKNKFMCTTSNVIIKYFDSLHINQDSARSMQLLLQVDEKLLPKTKKVNFQVEMPEYISLFDLDAKDKTSCIPTDIKEEIIVRDGKKYRRISMDVDSKWLYTLDGIGAGPKQRRYGKWVLITFDCAKDAPLGGGEKITYASSAHIDGKTYQSPEASMSLHVLPPIKGARFPTSYLMQYDIGPWMITLSKMSYNECERFLDNLERAGVNSVSYNEYGMNKDQLKQIRNRSFSIYAYIPVNAARSYRSNAFPGAEEYLKKHPDYRAVDRNGKSHDDGICFDIVSREDSPYDEEMYTWMAPYAEEFDALLWDYEVPPAAARSFCFCERCLNAFAEYAGLQSVNRD